MPLIPHLTAKAGFLPGVHAPLFSMLPQPPPNPFTEEVEAAYMLGLDMLEAYLLELPTRELGSMPVEYLEVQGQCILTIVWQSIPTMLCFMSCPRALPDSRADHLAEQKVDSTIMTKTMHVERVQATGMYQGLPGVPILSSVGRALDEAISMSGTD